MLQGSASHQLSALVGDASRYPEKTFFLGQVFKNITNSYKLVWFLAVLSLLRRSDCRTLRLSDVLVEMVVIAWHPVCLFRLSLGRQDKLQDVIFEIQHLSGLAPNVAPETIRRFVEGSVAAQSKLVFLQQYVPARFLTPWFEDTLRGRKDAEKTKLIKTMAQHNQNEPFASPYYFDVVSGCEVLKLNDSWCAFLIENFGVIESFTEHHFVLYLQARNPNVPGVVNKLRVPMQRKLHSARKFWNFVQTDFKKLKKHSAFRDIYSGQHLSDGFSIDHFLPWSFVVHDLLWNLTPVEPKTNSNKKDLLPDLDIYLPRLAKLHFAAIDVAKEHPKFLEDYMDCFKQDTSDLLALGESGFCAKYREIIVPQAQIARNQGFQTNWKFKS
jgi:hypothetical protein